MNCQEFESTWHEIARAELADAARREQAEAHAAACHACAARAADARGLTAGLRALASGAAQASPRVEAKLLAAFRERAAVGESINANERIVSRQSAPVVAATVKMWSWPKTFGVAGAAAAAAVVLVLLVPTLMRSPRTAPPHGERASQPVSKTTDETRQQAATALPPGDAGVEPVAGVKDEDLPAPRAIRLGRVPRRPLMSNAGHVGGRDRKDSRATDSDLAANSDAEIATDFIPLAQGGGFVAGEGAHVVRVELPRTALARFGLPVNAERAGGRVKADVLIGEDGMARAIRFVR